MGMQMYGRSGRWLYITAVIELVVAAVLAVIGFMSPILRGGMWLTAGILAVVALGLIMWGRAWSKKGAESQRIVTQGVPGQAAIVGMRQTGVYLNEQPQIELRLQVTTQMHAAYDVVVKEYVPLMMLGMLSSGRPLPVKVDPADPQRVVIEWENALSGGMAPGGMPPAMGAPSGSPDEIKARLLASGVPGTARVLSSTPTGQTDVQGRPVYNMMMEVTIEGRAPIQSPAMVGIPPERAEQLEPGDTVPVKADPNNPLMMAVDWDNA